MKKALLALLVALPLTACTSKTVYVTATTDAPPAPEPTPTYNSAKAKEDVYIATVTNEYPWVEDALGGRRGLIDFGNLVCQAIDEGSTLADFALMAVSNDVDPEMLGFIIGAAIVAFCPENSWFIEQYF